MAKPGSCVKLVFWAMETRLSLHICGSINLWWTLEDASAFHEENVDFHTAWTCHSRRRHVYCVRNDRQENDHGCLSQKVHRLINSWRSRAKLLLLDFLYLSPHLMDILLNIEVLHPVADIKYSAVASIQSVDILSYGTSMVNLLWCEFLLDAKYTFWNV